nr:reverse transcriptase domain-containing protein [Tanacetum cinerariifolium]
MRTRNSYFPNNSSAIISRRRNKGCTPNIVEPEFRTIAQMADNRTMEELLQAPTEGYGKAIVISKIIADHFEIKTNLLQLVQANPYHGFERANPHTHINNFKRITSNLKFRDVPNDVIKLMIFPYSLEGNARVWDNSSKSDDRIDKLADQISTLVDIFAKKIVTPALNQSSTSGTLPSNTIPNPKGKMKAITTRSGVAYEGHSIPTPKKVVERETEETTDKEQSNFQGSIAHIQPPVNPIAMLLKKLSEKLGDPGKFLIPYDFPGIDVCHALADPGASINLMPLSIWKKLSLPELTPTRMTLELANRSITRPKGVVEDVFVKVGKFHFPTDFVVVDFEADPHVPLILGRSFLRTDRALVDVYGEEITLRDNDKAVTFNLNQTTRYSSTYDDLSRCMMAIFHDMIEKTMEVFMDDFSVLGDSFSLCLSHLDIMLQMCEDTNLVLNWEKCHFMVKERIVLSHKIFKNRLEVDCSKIDVIAKLPYPTTVKGVRSFLGHVDFYRRFIQDFSEIARPMTYFLEKETPFVFSRDCIDTFETLKKKLTEAPILVVPDWNLPFELMCDASDFAIGAVLGQRKTKHFQPIHYASKTMTEAQIHYTMTEKEMLSVMYAFEKFRPYIVLSKSIVYMDHLALKYLLSKQDAKPRLIRWVLLLQEFDIIIRDKKGTENLAADHLSRLENPHKDVFKNKDINENFPLETLGKISSRSTLWFADFANFHGGISL